MLRDAVIFLAAGDASLMPPGPFSSPHRSVRVILGLALSLAHHQLMLSCLFLPTDQIHTQFSTPPVVSSSGLESWLLAAQGIESRHRLCGRVPPTRYIRNSGLVFVVRSARTRSCGLHPAEPDLCSSALHAFYLLVARQLYCSFLRSQQPSTLFSVPDTHRECVPEIVPVHSVVVGTTHASRVALRLCHQSNFDAL